MSEEERSTSGSHRAAPTAPLRAGLALSDLTVVQLWCGYIGLGGNMSHHELAAALHGGDIRTRDYDIVAQALNDHFVDGGGDHPVAYADEIEDHRDHGLP